MKFFVIILALVINVAFGKPQAAEGDNPTPAGYKYVINATRDLTASVQDNPYVYILSKSEPEQDITYYSTLGPDEPLLLTSYIFANGGTAFSNDLDHTLNTCDNFDDDIWKYVATEVVKKAIIPDGGCSVDKGDYTVYQNVEPITITSPEMIDCGSYVLKVRAYVSDQWVLQLCFLFDIPDNDNCNPVKPA